MLKIVFADNNYYLLKDGNFYGPFHSIADAESNRFDPPYSSLVILNDFGLLKNALPAFVTFRTP